ncbi:MAG: hypothetical protein MUF01_18130 [Bryobacterales bacterium]|jgi:hypothetical protein|nr:hypothetical protein [Bryobacterales bacterium]
MSDPLYFSLWLKDLRPAALMQQFEALVGLFPISALRPGVEALTVRAISDAEPELLDEAFEEPVPLSEAFRQAQHFLHDDCAYEFTTHWDLWRNHHGDWRLLPQEVRICCFAPEYENDMGDHIRFALGWDDQFLPNPADPASIMPVASNLRSVARLAQSLHESASLQRRMLWSSAEESFLSQLESTVFATGGERLQ